MMRFLLLIVLILTMFSCASKKSITQKRTKSIPNWVAEKPSDNEFYYGIGAAPILADSSHIEDARESALNDLASNIEVNVSKNAILKQLENNQNIDSGFQKQIQLSNIHQQSSLLEKATVFENQVEYWIMYRINKQNWVQYQKEQKQTTLENANKLYGNALTTPSFEKRFVGLALALDKLQPYWNESCMVYTNNDSIELGNLIVTTLTTMAKNVVVSEQSSLWLNLNNQFSTLASFKAICPVNGNIIPVTEVPFQITFLNNNQVTFSNQTGLIKQQIQVTNFKEQEGLISIKPQLKELVTDLVSNATQLIIEQLKTPVFVFEWQVEPPLIYIEPRTDLLPYLPTLKKTLLNKGFSISTNKKEANIIISGQTESWIIHKNQTSITYHTLLTLFGNNKSDKIIFSHNFKEVVGTHSNQEQAKLSSIEELKFQVDHWNIQSFLNVIFNNANQY
jgi:hypothetical protein